ncbi:hypothetical protein, partial [Streptomyces sp. NPDC001657]|uniref:hypothetical protein n=1 Tax=Streptomyces sp. NPDC001657 TaxID=3154522 RepID=UPI0033281C8B
MKKEKALPGDVRPVEERLRRAFAARAESIDVRDLRPDADLVLGERTVQRVDADVHRRRARHRVAQQLG